MRVLHTSDWHLGQLFFSRSRLAEQRQFLEWLRLVLVSLKIDLIIVAGDIFDTTRPSYEAQRLLADFLAFCAAERIKAVITSGNHDSAECLRINEKLANETNYLHIITNEAKIINFDDVIVAAAPFLLPKSESDFNNISTYSVNFFKDLAKSAKELNPKAFTLGVGHLATMKLDQDAEHAIYIGYEEVVDKKSLNMFDYFALGHIHKAMGQNVRYSGAPLAMSFAEANQIKSVSILGINEELDLSDCRKICENAWLYTINVPSFRQILSINVNSLDEIDFTKIKKDAYLCIKLKNCTDEQSIKLQQKARENKINLLSIKTEEKDEENRLKDVSLDDLSPRIVLSEVLAERGEKLNKSLEDELEKLELQAENNLASKMVEIKVCNED